LQARKRLMDAARCGTSTPQIKRHVVRVVADAGWKAIRNAADVDVFDVAKFPDQMKMIPWPAHRTTFAALIFEMRVGFI